LDTGYNKPYAHDAEGSHNPLHERLRRREYEIAIGALDAGHVEPRAMITGTVGLNEAPAAFEGLLMHNHHCKIQIAPFD
jgi:threonine dehydrogenase-like Zn-dependent dehydrogenase